MTGRFNAQQGVPRFSSIHQRFPPWLMHIAGLYNNAGGRPYRFSLCTTILLPVRINYNSTFFRYSYWEGPIKAFNEIFRESEHPPRADKSAVSAINRALTHCRMNLLICYIESRPFDRALLFADGFIYRLLCSAWC